jgi:glycosyltransferase involved in cell wall biosynthesis
MTTQRDKTRCCMITTVHPAFDIRIFRKEARSLAKTGYGVSIIAQHTKREIRDGVEIIPIPKSGNRALRIIRTLTALRLALKQEADIYHFHDPEFLYPAMILKLFGRRVVYDVHEDVPNDILIKDWIPWVLVKPISLLAAVTERLGAKLFDGIVAATPFIARKFPISKTVMVGNFPVLGSFQQVKRSRETFHKSPVVIYPGSLRRLMGIRQLVEAFSHIPEAELWLVGKFEDELFKKEIEEKAPSNVKLLGVRGFEEVPQLYAQANIGVICYLPTATHVEAMPTKIFEYMAAGLPIVASNFPSWRVLINGCGMTVDPEDPGDIARGIKSILKDADALYEMGERSRRQFIEKYNWEQTFPELLRLYKKILT